MTYFKDIGKGCNDFFSGRPDVPGNVDFNLGETFSLSVNQGQQTIEAKRSRGGKGNNGFYKYTQKNVLENIKPLAKLGGNLEFKVSNGKKTKYDLALKKLSLAGASVDVSVDGGAALNEAWTIKAKYGKLKNVNLDLALKGSDKDGKTATVNGTYTHKTNYVFGLSLAADLVGDKSFKGYGFGAQWKRPDFNSNLSLEISDSTGQSPLNNANATAKLDKKVNDDVSFFIQASTKNFGKFEANEIQFGGDLAVSDSSNVQFALKGAPDGKNKDTGDKEDQSSLRWVYTHKLGDNVTGSLSFDSRAAKGDAGLLGDPRLGWKLAFA